MNFTVAMSGPFQAAIDRVAGQGPLEVLSDGRRVAVILSPDDYATLRDACLQLDVPRGRGRGDWPA